MITVRKRWLLEKGRVGDSQQSRAHSNGEILGDTNCRDRPVDSPCGRPSCSWRVTPSSSHNLGSRVTILCGHREAEIRVGDFQSLPCVRNCAVFFLWFMQMKIIIWLNSLLYSFPCVNHSYWLNWYLFHENTVLTFYLTRNSMIIRH